MSAVQKSSKKPAPSKPAHLAHTSENSEQIILQAFFLQLSVDADINLDISEPETSVASIRMFSERKGSIKRGWRGPILSCYGVIVRDVLMQGTPKFLFLFQGVFNLPKDFRP